MAFSIGNFESLKLKCSTHFPFIVVDILTIIDENMVSSWLTFQLSECTPQESFLPPLHMAAY